MANFNENIDPALLELDDGPQALLDFINENGGVGDEIAEQFDFGPLPDAGNPVPDAGNPGIDGPGNDFLNFDNFVNYNDNNPNVGNDFAPVNPGGVFASPSVMFQGLNPAPPAAADDDAASGSSISANFRQAMSGLAVDPAAAANAAPGPQAGLAVPLPQLHLPQLPALPQPNNSLIPKLHHKRKGKLDASNDPRAVYIPPIPVSWGPTVGEGYDEAPMFQYFRGSAELMTGGFLTKEQLETFIRGRTHPSGVDRKLTLWIQNTPAQSNDRYAGGAAAAKCRLRGCAGTSNSILKGFFRIAIDEFSEQTGLTYDPMQNAGYVHLHCFETMFDLGFLVHHSAVHRFSILADTRNFAHETKNPASIERDHPEMSQAFNQWVAAQKDRADRILNENLTKPVEQWYTGFNPSADQIPPHPQRLGAWLTEQHIKLENKGRAQAREKRGGAHIGLHRGDLEKWLHLRREKVYGNQKGRRPAADDGDDDGDDNGGEGPSKPRQAPKVAPKASPKASSKVSPKAPPKVSPKTTSKNTKRKRAGNRDDDEEEEDDDDAMSISTTTTRKISPLRRSKRARNDKGKGLATSTPSPPAGTLDAEGDTIIVDVDDDIYAATPRDATPPSPTFSLTPPLQRTPARAPLSTAGEGPASRTRGRKRSRAESESPEEEEEQHQTARTLAPPLRRTARARAQRQQQREQQQQQQQQHLAPPALAPPAPAPAASPSPPRNLPRTPSPAPQLFLPPLPQANSPPPPAGIPAAGLPAQLLNWAHGLAGFFVPAHGEWHDDQLATRIGQLDRRQRFGVEAALARQERRKAVMGARKRLVVSF